MVVDPLETVEKEEDKDSRDTSKDLVEFSLKEEVVAAEPLAPAAEEALAQVAASASVLAWVSGKGSLWTSLQLFSLQLRHRSRNPCRELQPPPQPQWRHVRQLITVGKESPQSCERTSATSAALRDMRMSPPYGGRCH